MRKRSTPKKGKQRKREQDVLEFIKKFRKAAKGSRDSIADYFRRFMQQKKKRRK